MEYIVAELVPVNGSGNEYGLAIDAGDANFDSPLTPPESVAK
jgi:hypothetical protein